jgi:energy-coupling factor transport system permease protein
VTIDLDMKVQAPTGILDPRTKLTLAGLFFIFVVATKGLPALLVELAVVTGLMGLLGLWRAWIRSLRLLLSMVFMVFLIGFLGFGLEVSVTVSIRLITMVSVFFVFFQSTLPEDLGNSLIKMGVPYGFAFILTTSMRYVPVILRKIRDIMDAQKSRGISLEMRLKNLKNYVALLAPLLTQSFMMAEELARAMESRGFGSPNRSFVKGYRIKPWEYLLVGGCGAALIMVWLVWKKGLT